ncbi:galectin-1-like [Poeciliopsis prolifica]|uniref:galectin-1-like n=1 Tax=Poeciliopsis prolifica TaxID=188132 RepID=UPI0024135768|nr:galectin-1-like [Poeciliopsis prolifica]XP_054892147.1 galectin-1-like [Poeciliopsis prolifica]
MKMQLELKNVTLQSGDKLKLKGEILHDAERFRIDLGVNSEDLALHFNPRFHDDADGAVLVYNSKTAGCWGSEGREMHNPLQRGSNVKMFLKLSGDGFEVELPGGQKLTFPNRTNMNVITYIHVGGDFKLKSFKIYKSS